jgi:glycerol-3-phosphate O-acyltransferase
VVLSRFIRDLLSAGQAQMIFIEGGRSRTGKLLRPRYGILSKIVEGYQAGVTKDVVLVPVSVGYDRIVEEKHLAEEASGQEKKGESVKTVLWFSRKMAWTRNGKIYVHFDEPIFLSQYLKENPVPQVLERLASRICFGINKVSVVFPTAFVALVLLSHHKRSVSRLEMSDLARPLIRYLERRKVRFSDAFENREYAVQSALDRFTEAGLVKKSSEADLTQYTLEESKRLLLNYYKNNIIHFFATFSLLSVALLASERRSGEGKEILLADVEREYEYLRSLLEGEFTFRPKEARPAHMQDVLEFFQEEGHLKIADGGLILNPAGRKALQQYSEITFNFFETYALLFLNLKRLRGRIRDEKELLRDTLHFGRRLYAQGRIERVESLSKFALQSALTTAIEKGFLEKGDKKGTWTVTASDEVQEKWAHPLFQLIPGLG